MNININEKVADHRLIDRLKMIILYLHTLPCSLPTMGLVFYAVLVDRAPMSYLLVFFSMLFYCSVNFLFALRKAVELETKIMKWPY